MISAKIIADSVSHANKRITTFELEFPKYLLAEFNTHRMLSRNAASSRAIPVETTIRQIENDPAMPIFWGKNQAGMSAKEELNLADQIQARQIWLDARDEAIKHVRRLVGLGLHKQTANRILECWVTVKVVATATDWDNFFHLRNHSDAQPEIHELARQMVQLYYNNTPKLLTCGEWHLPYVDQREFKGESVENLLKLSTSLCAQTSYRKADDSIEKAAIIYDKLVTSVPVHSSPTEHQATPLEDVNEVSGNLRGWKQFRSLIPKNTCYSYDP